MATLDKAMERAQKAQRDAGAGQHGLFGVFDDQPAAATGNETLPEIPDWDEHTRLSYEKEILGFFITGHPLEKYLSKLKDFRALSMEEISAMKQSTGRDESICTGGVITSHKIAKSKRGDLYAQGTLEDMTGKLDFLLFSDNFKRLQERLKLEVPVLVRASVRVEEGSNAKLMVSDITPLEEAKPKLPNSLRLKIPLDSTTSETIDELKGVLAEHKGEARVLFDLERPGDFMVVMEAEGYNVVPDHAFIARVEALCGRGSVRVVE